MTKLVRVLGFVVLIGALIGGVVLVRQTQETRRGATYAEIEALFLPDSRKVDVGDQIVSTFILDTKTHKLSGVDARIKYDSSKLEVVSNEGGNYEVQPVLSGEKSNSSALFRSESDLLIKSVDPAKGLIVLAGISLEEDPTKMATGAVSLVKVTFRAKAPGSAVVTLDTGYDNMATGYNPSSSDQSLAIKTVKQATYVISTTSLPTPTSGSGIKPTIKPTAKPTAGVIGCKWCGTSCVPSAYKGMCLDVMPPAGQKCVQIDTGCEIVGNGIIVPTVKLTPGIGQGCNQRCTATLRCTNGLTCVPIWWPNECGTMPVSLLSKIGSGQALGVSEVSEAIKLCPEAKNALLLEGDRTKVSESGVISGSLTTVSAPALIGYCRRSQCPGDSDCICGGITPTIKPTSTVKPTATLTYVPVVTGTNSCSCPSGVPAKNAGNANCSAKVDLSDFEVWRSEAFDQGGIGGKIKLDWKADFNCDKLVNLTDFEMWRVSYFK